MVSDATGYRHQGRAREIIRGERGGRILAEFFPTHRRLGHMQPPLSPDYPGDFLHQMLLRGSVRCMLVDECIEKCPVFGLVLPRQNHVARKHAMTERIETRRPVTTGGRHRRWSWHRVHRRVLPRCSDLCIRVQNRVAPAMKTVSSRSCPASISSTSQLYVRHRIHFGFSGGG